ncbi:MAG: ATP-grasp domain-containing protein [Bacteroidales bacterium]|nr:ATP-grasp domain-containing protein [Bacteroidales bacterium]
MKYNVLLLGGDGTQTLPISKPLMKRGYSVHIFYRHRLSYGYATRYASHKIKSPSINDKDDFLTFFTEYVRNKFIDVVIPLSDSSAEFLSKNKQAFIKFCKFIVPDHDIFEKGYDKNLLMSVCRENGFPHPKTIDLRENSISTIKDSFFPAILKPNYTTGGRGMTIVKSKNELESIFDKTVKEYGHCHLQKLIGQGGRQFKVELFLDDKHQLINSSVMHKIRYYPVTGGSSCFNVTIHNDSLVDICFAVLKTIGWVGFADFDLIEDPDDGIIKILEINPRIPACIKSAVESGIDYGNIIVDSSLGNELKTYEYYPGKQLRHIGFDILWFFQSSHRFKADPNWFIFFGKKLSFQDFSLDDPLPFLFGTAGNIRKLISAHFRKSKSKTQNS